MNDFFGQFSAQAKALWGSMGAGPKVTAVVFLAAGILIVAVMGIWSSQPDYVPLCGGLSPEDVSSISSQLKDEKINFRYEPSRGTILVPAEKVEAARLSLASKGLPRSSTDGGFELFDKNTFAMTESQQKINFLRAMQTTLARNIQALDSVQTARVTITPAGEELFQKDKQQAKASVLLTLRSGRGTLTSGEVGTIRHLVACSVKSLDPRNITISDSTGKMYSKPSEADSGAGLSDEQLDNQKRVEMHYQDKIQSLLDEVLGTGRSVVRVSAQLSFDRLESRSTKLDADNPLVTSSEEHEEKAPGAASGPGGVPGTKTNATTEGAPVSASTAILPGKTIKTTKNNYTYSTTTENRVAQVGAIKALSVAVLVARTKGPDGKEVAWDAKERTKLEETVRTACDAAVPKAALSVKLNEMPFSTIKEEVKEAPEAEWKIFLRQHFSELLSFVGIIVMLFVLRRIFAKLTIPVIRTESPGATETANLPEGKISATMIIQEDLKKMITQNNTQAVSIIRSMLGK